MSQTDHRRSRVPLFSWVSAISLGGLLSFVIFLTGADSFDKMMVALDLRSVVHTHEMQSYRFGDLTVSAAEMSVENLDRDGVNWRGVQQISEGGEIHRFADEGSFSHSLGASVDFGVITDTQVVRPRFASAKLVHFCNVTARYKLGIPVYHLNAGIIRQSNETRSLTAEERRSAVFEAAQERARAEGADADGPVVLVEGIRSEFTHETLTLRWSACDDFDFPGGR